MGWAKGTVQPKTKTAIHHNLVRDWLKIKYQLSSGGLYSLFKTWVLFPAHSGGKQHRPVKMAIATDKDQ